MMSGEAIHDRDEAVGDVSEAYEPPPVECVDAEAQDRLWLRAITPILQARTQESDPSARVQLAMDMMYIAACERVARIMGGDMPK